LVDSLKRALLKNEIGLRNNEELNEVLDV